MTATPSPDTPFDLPFDPPFKCRMAGEGAERWVEVRADGSMVDCAAPVIVVPAATAERAPSRAPAKAVTTLKVPYAEKDEAKQLGARWDPKRKKWYVPAGVDAALFERWLEG
jgi:hypothetical protein